MNHNQKEAIIAGVKLAEYVFAKEDAQARALLTEALGEVRTWRGETKWSGDAKRLLALETRIEEFLK